MCCLQLSAYPAVAIRSSIAFSLAAQMNGDPNHDFALQMAAHHMVRIPEELLQKSTRTYSLHSTHAHPIAQRSLVLLLKLFCVLPGGFGSEGTKYLRASDCQMSGTM